MALGQLILNSFTAMHSKSLSALNSEFDFARKDRANWMVSGQPLTHGWDILSFSRGEIMGTSLFWAKKSQENDEVYHPLIFHLLDVANVSSFLWRECVGEWFRSAVIKKLGLEGEDSCEQFIAFLAGIHDIGKASPVLMRCFAGSWKGRGINSD